MSGGRRPGFPTIVGIQGAARLLDGLLDAERSRDIALHQGRIEKTEIFVR